LTFFVHVYNFTGLENGYVTGIFYMFLQVNISMCSSFMYFTAVCVGSALLSYWSMVGVSIIMPWGFLW